ncbi:DUF3375 domain-containing protein [Microbacterium bovistercoris]|uniref:DUF3375 domain-containing protein n=1 Tax=Microbacterium bovistercoris TaxID=2293570 RepID=A0A371NQV5_9MICO|nr:DUF3375 domain-containing protein [Microbacterium bovistercoris]REJ04521.1 DUF3375 domain-containing protein [Microbacterium bovistercoris]
MTGTRAEAAYLRALAAFKTPTLDLLHGRYAPFVVSALSLMFSADRPTVAVADAHVEVGEMLDQLRAEGYEDDRRRLPAASGREVCRYWVKVGWLGQQIEGETEVYRLTAHAVRALEIADLTGGGSRVSNSRVRTLLEAVERLAGNADGDPARRLRRLKAERDALDAQIAALESGAADPVPDDELLEEAENVLHLSRGLPADFTRVAESIKAMQRDVIRDLRRDERPTGEVLREYLLRGQQVMQSTREGQAFAGALRLIGDPERIDALTAQLHGLLSRPFAEMLDATQRTELDMIGRRMELGVQEVLTAQRRASHVIAGQVRTHDPARDRQVDELLRDVIAGLQAWTHTRAPETPVEPLRRLPVAHIGHLRQSLGDIRPPGAPAALASQGQDVEFLDADTRAWGGPHYAELEAYVARLGDTFDLGEAFEGAADITRRPVDLLGLLEIAHRGALSSGEGISIVEAVRPDGTARRFAFEAVTAHARKDSE